MPTSSAQSDSAAATCADDRSTVAVPNTSAKQDSIDTIHQRSLLWILRLAAGLCFAGWAWVHYYWEGPYGVLLWQDATYDFAESLGVSWEEFVGTGANDGWLQVWLSRITWLYVICTIVCFTVGRTSFRMFERLQVAALLGGCGLLVVLSYAKYLSAQRQLPMFVEHGGQMLAPLALVMAITLGVRHRVTVVTCIVAVVMTFAGHGCYAIDWWPTPSIFYGMTTVALGVEYETAEKLLRVAGVLDFLVCFAIFVPRIRLVAVGWATIWGLLTAAARPVAGMSMTLNYWGADQFLHEAVLRSPHFLLPLFLLVSWWSTETRAIRKACKKLVAFFSRQDRLLETRTEGMVATTQV
ncbi:hypothetical protein LOC71_00225 [Rhodopirellula sp. JC740]|uniref:Transmembrane protein n=1 Tax=Rhodopirellula halodulae TaxID=2894198 RepID=A0ABS8NAS5_9BACT|nr:hypothetical protein [Rhodopirellula sp. JC740]MCC9640682.1 hypothetical protein [Rhodopirellula sp. JC740]